MNINIITVGKIREKYIRHGIDEFLKRLRPYSSVKVTDIHAEELRTDELTEIVLRKEADKIFGRIRDNTYVIVLDKGGEKLSSEKFASKIKDITSQGVNEVVFVIGSSQGLADEVKQRADLVLSFSDMTFPHQLMNLILLEQIYRAFRILKNEPYHK